VDVLAGVRGALPEKTAVENSGIFGYDFINDVKTTLERACPGVISCADIIIATTRDTVGMVSDELYGPGLF
jgi:peroxidase